MNPLPVRVKSELRQRFGQRDLAGEVEADDVEDVLSDVDANRHELDLLRWAGSRCLRSHRGAAPRLCGLSSSQTNPPPGGAAGPFHLQTAASAAYLPTLRRVLRTEAAVAA